MSPVINIITHQPHKPITKTKKKMDTETVLEIIKMLDVRISTLNLLRGTFTKNLTIRRDNHEAHRALVQFRDHLQSFIEGQLNALENQTGE